MHTHDGWLAPEKARRLATWDYVFLYALWVNTRGWRKPPGWTTGKVPLRQLRPAGRPLTPAMCSKGVQRLLGREGQ